MRKPNKTAFIVLLCFALLFILGTILLLFVPEPKPLKIIEKPTVVFDGGEYAVHGKIKNVSKSEIVLNDYDLTAKISAVNENNQKVNYEIRLSEGVAVQPDEELDLSVMRAKLGTLKDVKLKKIVATPEHVGITLYGNVVNNGKFAVFALLAGVIGAAFLLIAIVSYTTSVKNARRSNNVIEQIKQTLGGGIYTEGSFGNKAEKRTAAAKTTASVFGAALSALFLGIGRYKVYSQGARTEFIITETSIYSYINGKFQNVTNELKSAFVNPDVTEKKNKVCVLGEDKNTFLTLRLTDGAERARAFDYVKDIFAN